MILLNNFLNLLQKYQEGLEEPLRGSEFIFDSVDLLYYDQQKTSLSKKEGSCVYSREWLKNRKATINPKWQKLLSIYFNRCIKLSEH